MQILDLFEFKDIFNLIKQKYRLLIYNVLNFLQILLGFIFQVLLGRFFGASLETDIYFVSLTILTFISTLGAFFTEMFMQYYNDIKVDNPEEARKFYQAVYGFSFLVGLGTFVVVLIFIEPINRIFVVGFSAERIIALKSFVHIAAFSLILTRLVSLNNTLINAEMRFMVPYLIGLLMPSFNIIFLYLYGKTYGINAIASSILLSSIVGIILQHIYIYIVFKITPGKKFWHPEFKGLIKTSFLLGIGRQIWGLKDLIITNMLSYFPAGTVSLYSYAYRIITVIFTVTNSPVLQIFNSKVSRLIADENFLVLKKLLRKTLLLNTTLFVFVLTPFIIFIPWILELFFGKKFSHNEIGTIYYLFLALIPLHIILTIETPFTKITIAMKQMLKLIKIVILFIIVYGTFILLFKNLLEIYVIAFGLGIAQMLSAVAYIFNVRKIFKKNLVATQVVE